MQGLAGRTRSAGYLRVTDPRNLALRWRSAGCGLSFFWLAARHNLGLTVLLPAGLPDEKRTVSSSQGVLVGFGLDREARFGQVGRMAFCSGLEVEGWDKDALLWVGVASRDVLVLAGLEGLRMGVAGGFGLAPLDGGRRDFFCGEIGRLGFRSGLVGCEACREGFELRDDLAHPDPEGEGLVFVGVRLGLAILVGVLLELAQMGGGSLARNDPMVPSVGSFRLPFLFRISMLSGATQMLRPASR